MNPTPKIQRPEQESLESPASETADERSDAVSDDAGSAADTTAGPAADSTDQVDEVRDGTAAARDAVGGAPEDTARAADAEDVAGPDDGLDDDFDDDPDDADDERTSSGVGSAAAAIVAVGLGIVGLTGTWTSRIVEEREQLIGQLHTTQSSTVADQIRALDGTPWHANALVNGAVALVALIVAVIVLLTPRRIPWVRPFAVAGVVLGIIGVLIAVGMYYDLFAALPSAPAAPAVPTAPAG